MLHNTLLVAATLAATLVTPISANKCQCKKVSVDVLIAGGGAGGAYAAAELHAVHNKSILVVDIAPYLGGHVNTVKVPGEDNPIDFGVLSYHNMSIVRDIFAAYDINLIADTGLTILNRTYLDYKTGKPLDLKAYSQDEFDTALEAWVKFGRKYEQYVSPAYNLPDPIGDAAPLLRPFRETVEELNLYAILSLLPDAHFSNDLLALPTMFAVSSFGYIWFDGPEAVTVVPESHNNTELYAKIQANLGDRVLLNTAIKSVRRNRKTGTSTIFTKGPAGECTEMTAKQIIVGFVPTTANMAPFDTTREEDRLWSKWDCVNLSNGLVTIDGIPDGTDLNPASPDPDRYGLPLLPNVRFINRAGSPYSAVYVYATPGNSGLDNAKKLIEQRIQTINEANVGTLELGEDVKYWGLSDHAPLACSVAPEDLAAGFWRDVNRLQGSDGMWYVGQAFTADLTAQVWRQTHDIVGRLVEKL